VKRTLWFTLLICPLAFGGSCPCGQTKEESALVQLEPSWAQALERHDSDAVGCILAEEFQEVDLDGMLRSRAENLASIINRRSGRYQLSELHAHVYGEFAYVRGLNTVLDAEGKIRAEDSRQGSVHGHLRVPRGTPARGSRTRIPGERDTENEALRETCALSYNV
jgi:ketosteroid isomerase-like protein